MLVAEANPPNPPPANRVWSDPGRLMSAGGQQFLNGGTYINSDTLSRFYAIHMFMIPGAIAALIGLHLYLVIRLGVTSPPWSKEAAGTGPLLTETPNGKVGRAGLSRFRRGK